MTTHDLRPPLNVISLGVGALLRRIPPSAPATPEHRQLRIIARSTEQMQRMAGDLLDLAAVETGQPAIEPTPTDPAAVISDGSSPT